jgi:ubiquinone/menaquinone biosynthesis C-methylase UbiE
MALRPSNRKRSRWAVALLGVQAGDCVLEVGFGPGLAIRDLARHATDGIVCGIDHSTVMHRQATARNRDAIEEGRVELRVASAADLGEFTGRFDRVLTVNNFGMWPDPQARLDELHRAMRPGGRVAIVSQPRCPGATAATSQRIGLETARQLEAAGFVNIRCETLNLRPPAVCVLADTAERD